MAELRQTWTECLEVVEVGIGGAPVTHGRFTADPAGEAEAGVCFRRVLQGQPWLAMQGSLAVTRRRVEVLEPVQVRR